MDRRIATTLEAVAGLALIATLCAGSIAGAQESAGSKDARIEAFKSQVTDGVDTRRKLAQVINDTVFSFGELAYQEFETSKYLTGVLEKNGFTVERGIAGIPTAWVARWGSGHPVIALGSDIDCLPKASQKPGVAYREPLVEGAPGHGEGHNSGQAVNIVAALAVKDLMEREKLPGTLMMWPGVAEELLGAKAYFVRAGMFRDVDAVLFTHVGDTFETSWGLPQGTGLISVEYTFEGESAARRRPALARPQRAARGRADEHRLGFPPRAAAARAALPLRDHQRRRPAQRDPAAGVGVVLLPRDRLREHQAELRDRQQDRGSRRHDDRHQGDPQS